MKSLRLKLAALLVICSFLPYLLISTVSAGTLNNRSLYLANPKPSAITAHTFQFDIANVNSVGSIVFEYCSNDPVFTNPCDVPVGMNAQSAVLASQTGNVGFSIHSSTNANKIVLTRPAVTTTSATNVYELTNITNPSTNNSSNYVRVSLHASTDGSGSRIDEGGLAFRILTGISTEAYVPPFLLFCKAVSVSIDCSSTSGSYVDLGELVTSQTRSGLSQYSGATNDESGFSVSVFGTTLTAGNQVIPALSTPTFSQIGTSQFGINLRANSVPTAGSEPVGPGSSAPSADYGIVNAFKFVSGDVISSSSIPTEYNRFTVTYMVNVSAAQPPGIYNATYTYIAVATF